MNIKTATQIVDNPPPINWEWLAGFFQAEGSLSYTNLDYPQLRITQKDVRTLKLIAQFLTEALNYTPGLYAQTVEVMQGKAIAQFLQHTTPYLRSPKHYIESILQTPFGWDFVTGFWEGDGSMGKHPSGGITYSFNQNGIELLTEVREVLEAGQIFQIPNRGRYAGTFYHRLQQYDGKKTLALTQNLLRHARTRQRRIQIVVMLMECNLELQP